MTPLSDKCFHNNIISHLAFSDAVISARCLDIHTHSPWLLQQPIAWFDFWSALTDNYSALWDECWTVLKKRCNWLMSRKGKASWSHFQCLINLGVGDFPRCWGTRPGYLALSLRLCLRLASVALSDVWLSPRNDKRMLNFPCVCPSGGSNLLLTDLWEQMCTHRSLPRAQMFKHVHKNTSPISPFSYCVTFKSRIKWYK